MKIWYQSTLSFHHYPNYQRALIAQCAQVASPGTEVVVRGRPDGWGGTLGLSDYASTPIMYHSVVVPMFIKSLLEAEEAGADAFIVASFSEPILPELRSLARIPVISMSESTFIAATMNAPKVGLVTLNKLVLPFLEKSKTLHQWSTRLSGIHLLEGNVTEADLDEHFERPQPYLDLLVAGVRAAISAGAQAVVPAEGVLGVMAARTGLREVDGVPIVDAVGTPVLFAELAVKLCERTGLIQSRAAYPLPSEAARAFLSAQQREASPECVHE